MGLLKNIFEESRDKINDNVFVFTQVVVNNNIAYKKINSDIPNNIFKTLVNVLNEKISNELVFVCRSKKEPNTYPLPKEEHLFMLKNINKQYKIFYQDPWPTKVPLFSDKKTVIRFGFDEGSEYDKMLLKDGGTFVNLKHGIYYFLVGKDNIFEVKLKKVML